MVGKDNLKGGRFEKDIIQFIYDLLNCFLYKKFVLDSLPNKIKFIKSNYNASNIN